MAASLWRRLLSRAATAAMERRLPSPPPSELAIAKHEDEDGGEEEDDPYAWNIDDDFDLLERQGCEMSKGACQAIIRDAGARGCIRDIRRVHQHLQSTKRREASLCKLLIEWYGRCGSLDEAKAVFDGLKFRNPEMWGCMVAAYLDCDRDAEAFALFRKMLQGGTLVRREVFAHALASCGNRKCLEEGKLVHACIMEAGLESRASIMNRVIDMYAACGALVPARRTFDSVPWRNAGTWASMIAAYAYKGYPDEALRLFWRMDSEGSKIHPEESTCVAALDSCSTAEEASRVHSRIVACGYDLRAALFNRYCELKDLEEARQVFEELNGERTLEQWETMVRAYDCGDAAGSAVRVLRLHKEMQIEGIKFSESAYLAGVFARCQLLELRP